MTELIDWDAVKSQVLPPDYVTPFAMTESVGEERRKFLIGAEVVGRGHALLPQQLLLADILALGKRFTSVILPRRSSKTTTLVEWLVGRCMEEPDLLTAYAVMSNAKAARRRYLTDIKAPMERWAKRQYGDDEKSWPFKCTSGMGTEHIRFANGSIMQVYGPQSESFRSDAFDVIVLDEAGEIEGDKAQDILAAAGPTQDTRPGAMLIYAGTAGKSQRGNMLWDGLAKATAGDPRHAGVAYWAPQNTLVEEVEAWEPDEAHPNAHARELVEAHHPGVGTLTTLESVKDNFATFRTERFMREYLGIFTDPTGGNSLIHPDRWSRALVPGDLPALPDRFTLGFAVNLSQSAASIVAAWRDEDGKACLMTIDHRPRVDWLAERLLGLSRKYKAPIAHDVKGVEMTEVNYMQLQTPRPKLEPYNFPMLRTAAAGLIKAIDQGELHHWGQPTLDDAARVVVKRMSGQNWLLGRPAGDPDADILDLEAGSIALDLYDRKPKRKVSTVFV
ncbi:hypothetical protein HII28_00410 [Planctomonas sp. JC2975]|uniref:hypothetical protein n=1 Tax=Planctomonas sp. JC2975 TaxID=2729626 RepID=UPI001472C9E1|nr:hypothetical protein [Planctomonas sp. JC2975]NNC10347.1 hypothetical protein [Planctomonas sp. JC2975]